MLFLRVKHPPRHWDCGGSSIPGIILPWSSHLPACHFTYLSCRFQYSRGYFVTRRSILYCKWLEENKHAHSTWCLGALFPLRGVVGGCGGGGLGGSSSGSQALRIPFMNSAVWSERRLVWTGVPSHCWLRVTPACACAGINNPSLLRRDISRRSRLPRRWRGAAYRPRTPLRHPSQLTGCTNHPKVAPNVQEPVTRKSACQLWLWWRFSVSFVDAQRGEGSFPNRLGAAGFETNLPLNI